MATKPKRRRCLTIENKIKLLDRMHAGEKPLALSRKCQVSESAIRSLLRCEKSLREYASRCSADVYKSISYFPRSFTLERAEQLLVVWYEEQRAKGCTLTIAGICSKARKLYGELKSISEVNPQNPSDDDNQEEKEHEFKASKGWFIKFRKRYNLDFKTLTETDPPDAETAEKYRECFKSKVRSGDYQPQQVFSASQFSLAWKHLPERTVIAQGDRPSNKVGHDRLSLLFCGNAHGSFVVKPILVYRTLAPYCLRSRNSEDLPVFWRARPRCSQRSPKVTPDHFQDWLTQCFIPSVHDYLQIMELPQRCMLLLDADLLDLTKLPIYDDTFVRLEFLPPNTQSLLQPISLSVVPLFKCIYFRRLLAHFHFCLEQQPAQSLFKVWRNFDISAGIDLIEESLDEISGECWTAGWWPIWKEIVPEPFSSSELIHEVQRIVDIGCSLPGVGFADMTMEDIENHLKLKSVDVSTSTEKIFNNVSPDEADTYAVSQVAESLENICDMESESANLSDDIEMEVMLPQASGKEQRKQGVKNHIKKCGKNKSLHSLENAIDENTVKDKACRQLPNINRALAMSAQLSDMVGEISSNRQEHLKFVKDLNALMQPYKDLKDRLLQPSISDFFPKKNLTDLNNAKYVVHS